MVKTKSRIYTNCALAHVIVILYCNKHASMIWYKYDLAFHCHFFHSHVWTKLQHFRIVKCIQTLHHYMSWLVGLCANTLSENVFVYILKCNTDYLADKKKKHIVLAVGGFGFWSFSYSHCKGELLVGIIILDSMLLIKGTEERTGETC